MADTLLLGEFLQSRGVSRRTFLRYTMKLTALLALPPAMAPGIARALEQARRPSLIWLSFQECTGCTESLTRAHAPSLENLIFDFVSLDYHHTLQAASGHAAESARERAMAENRGKYLVVVDGSVPLGHPGFSTIAGIANEDMLRDVAKGAAAMVALGTCAAFGGLPGADPNPTGAVPISAIIKDKPIMNLPGCPPIPVVIAGALAHVLVFGRLPDLDGQGRPRVFYGETIHDRCYRRPFYDRGLFASSFDDEGARQGWCLYKLGCKGPLTRNACATLKWNGGTSFPIQAGHPCLGCSEAGFWDGGDFYRTLAVPIENVSVLATASLAAGAALGAGGGALGAARRRHAAASHETVTIDDLEKTP